MPPKGKQQRKRKNNRPGRFRTASSAARNLQKLGTATEFLRAPHSRYDTIENSMPVFPMVKRARLNYHTYADLFTGSSGLCGTYVFAANGLYDPDITGTGHQPIGFDQMMFFYYHYTVVRAKITVIFRNNSVSIPAWCAVSRNGSSTAVTVPDELIESGNIEYRRLNRSPDWDCIQKIVFDMDVSQFAGVPHLLDDSDYRGTSSANPADIEYFHISVWNTADATSFTINCDVLIEFEALFTEPRKLASSLALAGERKEEATETVVGNGKVQENIEPSLTGPIVFVEGTYRPPVDQSTGLPSRLRTLTIAKAK